jgi:hypothetical protein
MILPIAGEKVGQRQTIPLLNKARHPPLAGFVALPLVQSPP